MTPQKPTRSFPHTEAEPGALKAAQAALATLLFYSLYVALAGEGLAIFALSIVSIGMLVFALLKSGLHRTNPWFFPGVLVAWLLYLLASYSQPGSPFVHWWPLPLLASVVLLAIRLWVALAMAVLVVLTLTTSGQHQVNFLHLIGLPFMTALLLCLYLAQARHKMSGALQQALGTDLATGCDNKSRLQQLMQELLDALQRYAIPASVIVLHVQFTPGGLVTPSDTMLQTLCSVWRSRLRATDRLCRLSDNRFVCLLSNTPVDKATFARDDLLKAAAHYEFADKSRLTLSSAIIDIAEIGSPAAGLERLITWQCH